MGTDDSPDRPTCLGERVFRYVCITLPYDETTGEHEEEDEGRRAAVEGVAHHDVRVGGQNHQQH